MSSNHLKNIIVRSLSTSSVSHQMIKPPIQIFGMGGRYATALYSAATKMKQLEAVESDLIKFQGLMKTDKKLEEFIRDPTQKRSLKMDALKQISSSLKMAPSTANLVVLLAENGRLGQVNTIINAFKTIMSAHRGEIACEVTTAKPLDDAAKQELTAALKAFTKKGENILLETKIDPAIIGGMIVVIGDKYVDMSIASKVKKYREIIETAV